MARRPLLPPQPADEAGASAPPAFDWSVRSAMTVASATPPGAAPGVVAAVASRTVLAVGPNIATLSDPCLAVAREGVLLAFSCQADEADAAWRLAARLAGQGAVALPLWPEAAGPADTLVTRVIEDFGRLDGVLVVAGGSGSPAGDAISDLLRAAARRLGRGQPRVEGQFVVVWRGEAEGLDRLRESLAARAADGSCPGAGRHWEMHVTAWPANADEAATRGRELAAWLGPARTAASVPENPASEKN